MKTKKYIFITISFLVLFTACNNRPIFSAIEQEIELKKFSVEGNIIGLVQINNDIYAATPQGVYTKGKDSNDVWSFIGYKGFTQSIATDGTDLYACFMSEGVYKYNTVNSNWDFVTGSSSIRKIFGNGKVFGYDGNDVYEITAGGIGTSKLNKKGKEFVGAANNYFAFADGVYKDDGSSVPGPNAPASGIKALCKGSNANSIFVLTDSKLCHYDGTAWTDIAVSEGTSVSYFKHRSNKTILIGCQKGYKAVKLTGANLAGASVITHEAANSQYESTIGSYLSTPILGVERTGGYAIFMGIHAGILKKKTGLWGFYSNYKREWNRE